MSWQCKGHSAVAMLQEHGNGSSLISLYLKKTESAILQNENKRNQAKHLLKPMKLIESETLAEADEEQKAVMLLRQLAWCNNAISQCQDQVAVLFGP